PPHAALPSFPTRRSSDLPADADEAARLMEQTLDWPGPIYIRLAKGGDAIVSKAEHGFQIGRAILMRLPGDVLMVTTGIMLQRARSEEHTSELQSQSNLVC